MKVLFIGLHYSENDKYEAQVSKILGLVFRDIYDAIEPHCEGMYMLSTSYMPEATQQELKKFPKLKVIRTMEHSHSLLGQSINFMRMLAEGTRLIKSEGIDVVTHVTGEVNYGLEAVALGLVTRRRSVLRIVGDIIKNAGYMGRYRSWRKPLWAFDMVRRIAAHRLADAVIVLTKKELKRVVPLVGDNSKVFICPRGIDTRQFPFSQRSRAPKSPMVVLFVGRKSMEKGYDILIEAARLLEGIPEIEFRFVGGFEPGRQGNLNFVGLLHYSKTPQAYAQADVVAMPSRNEALPQVMLEAMSCGKAVICNEDIYGEFVPAGTGILCKCAPEDFAAHIKALWEDPALALELGSQARSYVEQEYSKVKFQKLYLDIIEGKA